MKMRYRRKPRFAPYLQVQRSRVENGVCIGMNVFGSRAQVHAALAAWNAPRDASAHSGFGIKLGEVQINLPGSF